jgi:cold shock CspA family protein
MSEATGEIVFYDSKKEFGFIRPDGAEIGRDVFFHIAEFDDPRTPAIGDKVGFMIEVDPRREGRRRAKAVTPISGQS